MSVIDIVTKGSLDRSVTIRIIDSTDGTPETSVTSATTGLSLWYRREGEVKTGFTATDLGALTTAHTNTGILHVSDGIYRVDLADAAFATSAEYVDVGGTATDMIVIGGRVRLIDVDLEDATRGGMTALPNAAAQASGGLYTRGTGAGQINQDANGRVDINVAAVSTSATSANNLELDYDGTGYAKGSSSSINSVTTGATVAICTEARLAELDAAKMPADIDNILADTANLDANQSQWATATSVTVSDKTGFSLSTGGVDAIWNEATVGHVTAGTYGVAITDILADTSSTIPGTISTLQTAVDACSTHTAANVVDEWETQSLADPNGFRVNVMEVGGTAQTANDNGADINSLISSVGTAGDGLTALATASALATMQGDVTLILADTGTDIPATLAALPAATWAVTTAESTSEFSYPASFGSIIAYMGTISTGVLTQTSNTTTLKNRAGTSTVAEHTVSDVAGTFTSGAAN